MRSAESFDRELVVLSGPRQYGQDGYHVVRQGMIRLMEAEVGNRSSEQHDGLSSAKDI
ncbi:MAG: hypothetical protein QM706_21320 [Nitrospira sp.]